VPFREGTQERQSPRLEPRARRQRLTFDGNLHEADPPAENAGLQDQWAGVPRQVRVLRNRLRVLHLQLRFQPRGVTRPTTTKVGLG